MVTFIYLKLTMEIIYQNFNCVLKNLKNFILSRINYFIQNMIEYFDKSLNRSVINQYVCTLFFYFCGGNYTIYTTDSTFTFAYIGLVKIHTLQFSTSNCRHYGNILLSRFFGCTSTDGFCIKNTRKWSDITNLNDTES